MTNPPEAFQQKASATRARGWRRSAEILVGVIWIVGSFAAFAMVVFDDFDHDRQALAGQATIWLPVVATVILVARPRKAATGRAVALAAGSVVIVVWLVAVVLFVTA